jgi:Na+-driven multidrug efflux pump
VPDLRARSVPALGVTGAALATVIGRSAGVTYQLFHLFGGHQALRLDASSLLPRPRLMLRLARIAMGGIMQFLFATSAWIGLMRIVAGFGSGAVAGYTIAIRLVDFAILPMWGLGNAAATMVGQNLGAGSPQRAEQAVWLAARVSLVVMGTIGLVFLIVAPHLMSLLIDDADAVRHGTSAIRFFGAGLGIFSVGMMMIQALNGAGDTDTPMYLNFVVFWMIQLPLAWCLARHLALGPDGVFAAVISCETVLAVASIVIIRRGRWKLRTV